MYISISRDTGIGDRGMLNHLYLGTVVHQDTGDTELVLKLRGKLDIRLQGSSCRSS